MPATVPSTAASCLQQAGLWSLDSDTRRFDAEDWWYRVRFHGEPMDPKEQTWLCCDGLASVADVWLNGTPLLHSTGMFSAHERRVDQLLAADNELVMRFRSLDALLAARRPRPRWRAPMVEHQQLRWFRTTLLGRTPGWSPPAAVVGPWRDVRLEHRRGVTIDDVHLTTDALGTLAIDCRIVGLNDVAVRHVALTLERNDWRFRADLDTDVANARYSGRWSVPDVEQWWPHTHGEPALYQLRLHVSHSEGDCEAELGTVGFRNVTVNTKDGDFALSVNGAPVFARGACWTPLDPVSLSASAEQMDQAFDQIVDAGMNMVRVGGTMVYESDHFLDQCDTRGVLLWQDFMFANMDYPDSDAAFVADVREEVRQQLARVQGRPSLAVLCGNSEGEQQASMWGATRDRWHSPLFHEEIAQLARQACPDVEYWPSSAHGGAFPHQNNTGTTSYYGVGAYLRPFDDARRAEIRFATECLAFANIPEERTLALLAKSPAIKVHHAAWKARSPRDLGAGWDFDDVRDHYLQLLFRVDPMQLRYADHERYLTLGRVATGEAMSTVFAEWRRLRSNTRGGLVWFMRDLWPGAGWGLVDSLGVPKAAWHYVRRSMAPLALHFTDEGGNGLALHAVNDGPGAFRGDVEVQLFRAGEIPVGRVARPIEIGPNSAAEIAAASLFDWFADLNYAFRFGPPAHDLVCAVLRDHTGVIRGRAFHFAVGLPNTRELDIGLTASLDQRPGGGLALTVGTRRFAQSVHVEVNGLSTDDNYFHMAPGEMRHIELHPIRAVSALASPRPASITVRALNAEKGATVTIDGAGGAS